MLILDWKANKQFALANGIALDTNALFAKGRLCLRPMNGTVSNTVFRNFPQLNIADVEIMNCTFEDCGDISFDECKVGHCTFQRIETIYSSGTAFTDSRFHEFSCDNDMIISMEDSEISHCSFDDVELRNDSYLFDGTGSAWIEHCGFTHIRTSREDREIAHCEETVGKIFKCKKQYCIIDENTCTGLVCVADLDGTIEIGSFDLEVAE